MIIKPKEKQSQVRKLFSKFQAIVNRTIAMINLIIIFVFTYLGLKVFSRFNTNCLLFSRSMDTSND